MLNKSLIAAIGTSLLVCACGSKPDLQVAYIPGGYMDSNRETNKVESGDWTRFYGLDRIDGSGTNSILFGDIEERRRILEESRMDVESYMKYLNNLRESR